MKRFSRILSGCAVALFALTAGVSVASTEVPEEPGLFRTDPTTNAYDYLLISPPVFYSDWCWYVEQRREAHPDLRFAVKNTADIYDAHPFAKDLPCRNAAESIHAYLRSAYTNVTFKYVVLGGAWLDAQNLNGYTPYFTTGEAMSLSNCVPGIYGFPRENWRQIPSDMFYACIRLDENEKFPWDANGDGKYIDQNDCANNNLWPDVCVSRITLNPQSGWGGSYNQHALVTNYVAKLKRGEAKDFAGHYRYGFSAASTGSSKLRKSGDRMCYTELEFYDGLRNMFDPLHHDSLEDCEYSVRTRTVDQYSMWRPVRSVKGMMNYTWTGGQPTLAAAMDDYYAADRDFAYVQAHGWAQGAAQFSASRFATAKGLTLFNGGSGPCETGYPDYHVERGGKHILQYNVGDAAVTNPDGGALASVNNSRWSWAGGGGYGAMSYYMLNEMLIGFNEERKDVGHAWLRGVRNYWCKGRWGNTAGWVLTEQFLYGDPLVRLPQVPHVWWKGGATGVWDRVTENWTNNVDAARTFDAASNVYFNVEKDLALDVAGEIAALRLSLPVQEEAATLTLAGTGSLRVLQAVDVAGTNTTLRLDVAGGVGHDGIRFVTGAGNLVFGGTNRFYVAGVSNARQIRLAGGGVTLDVDEFPAGSFPLVFDGRGEPELPEPNILRSKNVGGLVRFGPLALTNTYVKLSTVDAFGRGAPLAHTLVDSTLEIGANVYYQRSGFPEGLNATFAADGDSSVTSSLGGLWTVKHTTTFALGSDAHLTLAADTADGGGRIVITNASPASASNVVTVAHGSALAGDVVVGKGIRLVLDELPLSSVTSLAIGEGATVELPEEESGYWQIVPVSAKLSCAKGVTFASAADPTNRLAGSASTSGSFFRKGALYEWTGAEGDWNTFFANRHPKILFGDLADTSVVTVRVAAAVSPDFAFFSNLKTAYLFAPAADDASVLFSSVSFCGPTSFDVPVGATEYVEISGATSRFCSVQSPSVHVAAGAGLALAGSHWTDFRLDEGAVLVAARGETLDWNAETTFAFPDRGTVLVDVGAFELSATPTPIVTGLGHAWTLGDLQHLSLVQSDAEFRIVDGALCVVRGDGLKGPYELRVGDSANWNSADWTADGTNRAPFGATWSDRATDWSADATIVLTDLQSPTFSIDCDVHLTTLAIQSGTNDFTLVGTNGFSSLHLATLDLMDCHGTTDIAVDTGDAAILTESATNGTDVIRLRGSGSGTITLAGVTVILDRPGAWSLASGAQGILRVVAPQAYERFRVASVSDDFTDSGFTVVVTDSAGNAIDGFRTSVSDGALWCVPPALQAEVPPGTNEITRLDWRDVLGNVVSNVDWTSSAGFRLIGTETSGVVIAKSGFSSLWNRLSVSNEVTIYGREVLSPTQIPGGDGVLALAGAFTLKADVNATKTLLSGAKLKLNEGTTLEIRHQTTNFDARSQDWSGITGTGRVAFLDPANTWIALPSSVFASTLSVETASDVVLTEGFCTTHPLALRNLSGSGSFRSDWSTGNPVRPVRTVQTGVTAFSGYLHKKDGRTSTLAVASDDAVASTNKALILNGAAVEPHQLDIETNGCVILTGSWQGPITVKGLLVITNSCATNGLSVTIAPGGAVREIDEADLPKVTAASDYVEPTYPDDPVPQDGPVPVDARTRIVTAAVGPEDGAWMRLDWLGTNGLSVANLDWSAVTNATLAATNGAPRIVFDAADFAGVARLVGDVTVEARSRTPFTLAAESEGAVDFRLSPEPAATCDLLCLQPSTSNLQPSTAISVHDRYGRAPAVAGEVAFDATAGKYRFEVQNVNGPTYSCTFDTQYEDSLTSALWFSGSGNLTCRARPDLFETSRSGMALRGAASGAFSMYSHNGCQTYSVDSLGAVTLHLVAKLPTNDTGTLIGLGSKHSGNGLALARTSENVAGVYVWENGGGMRLVASANVPFASEQFHAYAVTHDGRTLRFYVDGLLAREAELVGRFPSTGYYQWFNVYGGGGGLSGGASSVVDDFRLYLNVCLTPTSVAKIAEDFPPWPTQPTAEADVPDLAWSDLCWSAVATADDALTLVAGAGSLRLDAPVVVSNALAVTGGAVPLALAADGELRVPCGLTVASELAIDASPLDGTNLASYAVANVPYARWLLRGAFTGTVRVTDLPEVPEGYGVRVESFANLGVRLVFTAPRYAFAEAYGLSVGNDDFASLADTLGLHPTSPTNWHAYATWTNEPQAVGGLSVAGSEGGAVDEREPYGEGAAVARYFTHTSFDGNNDTYNGKTNGLSLTGLSARFAKYRVLVYLATDTEGAHFGPVTIAGRTYTGVSAGAENEDATVADSSALAWGKSLVTAATEGVNVVISDVLTADAVTVFAQRLKVGGTYARGQIAAIEIVEVGKIHAFAGSRYSADVTATTEWRNGDGTGLQNHSDWRNDAFSSICLTAKVDVATLTFDTPVTTETFRVVTTSGQTLALARRAEMSVYALDLSDSEGTVVLGDGLNLCGTDGSPIVLAAAPRGALDIAVDNISTNRRLMKLAADFDASATNCAYRVHAASGAVSDDPGVVIAVDGWLVLEGQSADKPHYSLTFEGTLTNCLDGTESVSLVREGNPSYVDADGGRQAMTGDTPYSDEPMASVPASWTIHAVARMPKESNGILFGYGCDDERGVGLVTVDANTVAVAGWDGRGRYTVLKSVVTNATCQFHAYALVSTGTRAALYVDGVLRGSVAAAVNPDSPRLQIGSIYGGTVSGFAKTETGAVDEWRLYDGVLSAQAIAALAASFPPWPDYRTATLTETDADWSDLLWSDATDGTCPRLLDAQGGSLAVTDVCTIANALFATGQALTLHPSDGGCLEPAGGLTLLAGWTIDCADIDATNLTARADEHSPHVHWLVRGAYAGDDPLVTNIPALPNRYAIGAVCDTTLGVWLSVSVRSDYVATLTNSTAWARGTGPGLDVHADSWANDATSTITLTQSVDSATLAFDTPVTAARLAVVSTGGQTLALRNGTNAVAIARYDFTAAAGTVALADDVPADTVLDLGLRTVLGGAMNGSFGTVPSGAFLYRAQPNLTLGGAALLSGVTNGFASAVVNGDVYSNRRTYLVRAGDDLTIRPSNGGYDNYRFSGHVTVTGGRLLLDSKNQTDRFWYGVCGDSSFTQTGGETIANARSEACGGANNGCFLIGNTGGGDIPFVIRGGTFSVPDSPVCFWQRAEQTLNVGGTGVVRVKGLWGNGRKGTVSVDAGGVLSVGAKGVTDSLVALNLNGGTLTAHADATTAMALTLGGDSTLAAESGVTHTVTGAIAGDGGLTVGAAERTGTVVLASAFAFAHPIELVAGVLDLGTNRPAQTIARTGGQIHLHLTSAEEASQTAVPLLAVPAGEATANYRVFTSGGAAVDDDLVTIEKGVLTVDATELAGTVDWSADRTISRAYTRRAIRVTEPLTLTLADEGAVTAENGLDASAGPLTIDVNGLDGTNLVKNSVAGAPYSHWIVKGIVSGTVTVTNFPAVPEAYSVTAETVPTHGVRLVVTANRAVRLGAISVNLSGHGYAVSSTDTATHGAHPVAGAGWNNVGPGVATSVSTLKTVAADGTVADAAVTFANPIGSEYNTKVDGTLTILRGYHDDGNGTEFTLSGIPYEKYRLIVYYATDTADYGFAGMLAGASSAQAVGYYGAPQGASGCATLTGASGTVWGNSNVRTTLEEGVNYLVTDVLSGGGAYVRSVRDRSVTGRATIAAIQVVKVGAAYLGPLECDEVKLASKLDYVLPGSAITQSFGVVYHPLGSDDHNWATAANWASVEIWQRPSGAIETNYTAWTANVAPALKNGSFVPVLFDGCVVTGAVVEGWVAQYGLFRGADVTIGCQTKFQGDGSSQMFVAVDETSRLTIENWGGGSYEKTVNFYLAAPSGLVAKAAYAKNAPFDYWLTGRGSAVFAGGFSGTHRLRACTIDCGDSRGTERRVEKKYLILGKGTVTTDGATVTGGVTHQTDDAAVTELDPVGTYRFGHDETGTFVEWVAFREPEILEIHPSETDEIFEIDETNRVKIVCTLTNGSERVKVDLTSAFTLDKVPGGMRATLDPSGHVLVPAHGSVGEELIAVRPELGTVADDEHVATEPFVVREGTAAVGVKTIPGLVYRLMRGGTPAGAADDDAHEAARVQATATRHKLEDAARPPEKAFYLIRVEAFSSDE